MNITKPFITCNGYGWTTINPTRVQDCIDICVRKIESLLKKKPFDAFAYMGSSGAAFAYILGMHFKIPVLYVRKKGEKSHGNKIESNTRSSIRSYLIIDDMVDSGNTLRYIVNTIDKYAKDNSLEAPECVGAFLYSYEGRSFNVVNKKKTILCFTRECSISKALSEAKADEEAKAIYKKAAKKRKAKSDGDSKYSLPKDSVIYTGTPAEVTEPAITLCTEESSKPIDWKAGLKDYLLQKNFPGMIRMDGVKNRES